MSKTTQGLLEWYELDEALELFADPVLNQDIASIRSHITELAKRPHVTTGRVANIWRRLNAPDRVSPDQRRYDEAVETLGKLEKQRRRQFRECLVEGTIQASAKRAIGDSVPIFLPSDAWAHLKLPQNGISNAADGSVKFYCVRFSQSDPAIMGKLEEADRTGKQPKLGPRKLVMLLLPKLFPDGPITGTLKEARSCILAEFDRLGWERPSANTVTNALEDSGLYKPTPHLKNR